MVLAAVDYNGFTTKLRMISKFIIILHVIVDTLVLPVH